MHINSLTYYNFLCASICELANNPQNCFVFEPGMPFLTFDLRPKTSSRCAHRTSQWNANILWCDMIRSEEWRIWPLTFHTCTLKIEPFCYNAFLSDHYRSFDLFSPNRVRELHVTCATLASFWTVDSFLCLRETFNLWSLHDMTQLLYCLFSNNHSITRILHMSFTPEDGSLNYCMWTKTLKSPWTVCVTQRQSVGWFVVGRLWWEWLAKNARQ